MASNKKCGAVGCIDLKARFGDTYRVVREASHTADRGDSARAHDPWLLLIPCLHGHIYPHGGELLGASTDRRGPIAKALASLPGVRVVQDGSDGITVTFPVAEFEAIAAVLKPRRRRVLTPEHRERLLTMGANHRFAGSAGAGEAGGDGKRDPTPTGLPEAA
jgi:hypothetical protein